MQKDGDLYMSDFSEQTIDIPPEQQAIRAKCFHPTGTFIEFRKEEIEQSGIKRRVAAVVVEQLSRKPKTTI